MKNKRYLLYILAWIFLTTLGMMANRDSKSNALMVAYLFASMLLMQIGYFHITITGDKYIKNNHRDVYEQYNKTHNRQWGFGYPVCVALRLSMGKKYIDDPIVIKLKHEIVAQVIAIIAIIPLTIMFCVIGHLRWR